MIFLELFLNFLKIGLFTIGGGYAMLPLISDTVVSKGWIAPELLIDFVAIAESTPGPFAVNVATFVGATVGTLALGGFGGALLGVLCTVGGLFVPSFVIILIVYKLANKLTRNRYFIDAFTAVRPTVVALVASAFVTVALSAFSIGTGDQTSFSWFALVWFALCFATLRGLKKVHPIFIILVSAGIGILYYGVILGGI